MSRLHPMLARTLLAAAALWAAGTVAAPAVDRVPFTMRDGGVVVQVSVDNQAAVPMLVDLGAGTNVLDGALGARYVAVNGKYATLGLTGQRVDLPIGTVLSLGLGPIKLDPTSVAIWSGLDGTGIAGLVSARSFRNSAVTFDYVARELVAEDAVSYPERRRTATKVGLTMQDDLGIWLTLFTRFDFGHGVSGLCELTGQPGITLDRVFASKLGVNLADPSLPHARSLWGDRVEATIPSVALAGAPQVKLTQPKVGFADLVHDCNVGNAFWEGKIFTLDVPARAIFVQTP